MKSEFIYNQHKIPKKKWRYGFRSSAATGCGWIATYNALLLMGYYMAPEKLIRWYQLQFPLVNGNLGTFLPGAALFFKLKGFRVKLTVGSRSFDRTLRQSDAGILFYYWRNKFRFGAHFVAVRYQEGEVLGYNTYSNSAGPDTYGPSLHAFLKKRKYFCPVLITIKKSV